MRSMLCFLPLTATELDNDFPPDRTALVPKDRPTGPDAETPEFLEEEARDDAAFESLEYARIAGTLPTRLVASFEVGARAGTPRTWDALDSIYVDDTLGRAICARLLQAQTQEAADALAEDLYDEPMMWFDGSERESLARMLQEQ